MLISLITARKRSYGKVMFSQVSVSVSTGGGWMGISGPLCPFQGVNGYIGAGGGGVMSRGWVPPNMGYHGIQFASGWYTSY